MKRSMGATIAVRPSSPPSQIRPPRAESALPARQQNRVRHAYLRGSPPACPPALTLRMALNAPARADNQQDVRNGAKAVFRYWVSSVYIPYAGADRYVIRHKDSDKLIAVIGLPINSSSVYNVPSFAIFSSAAVFHHQHQANRQQETVSSLRPATAGVFSARTRSANSVGTGERQTITETLRTAGRDQ